MTIYLQHHSNYKLNTGYYSRIFIRNLRDTIITSITLLSLMIFMIIQSVKQVYFMIITTIQLFSCHFGFTMLFMILRKLTTNSKVLNFSKNTVRKLISAKNRLNWFLILLWQLLNIR